MKIRAYLSYQTLLVHSSIGTTRICLWKILIFFSIRSLKVVVRLIVLIQGMFLQAPLAHTRGRRLANVVTLLHTETQSRSICQSQRGHLSVL